MTIDEFWNIVDRVHAASPNDMEQKCRLLAEELRRLPRDEVQSFQEHYDEYRDWLNTSRMQAVADVIMGGYGCGDDHFMDFRSTLISLGRKAFEAAITNADSLADSNRGPID